MAGSGDGLFVHFDKTVMDALHAATQGKMMAYAGLMATLIQASISLYVLVSGYRIFAGKLQRPVESIVWDLAKMSVILAFMLNIGGYLNLTIDALNGMRDGFASVSGKGDSPWAMLDSMWETTGKLGTKLIELDPSTYVKLDGGIAALFAWIGALVTMLVSAAVFVIAEITMLIMGIVAPVFIFCMLFGFLRQMFNNWLQIIFSSILTILFATLFIGISIGLFNEILTKANAMANASNLIVVGAQACATGLLAAVLVWLSSKFATQLAGVGVEGTMQAAAAMGVGVGLFGASKAAQSMVKMGKGGAKDLGKGMSEGFKGDARTTGRAGYAMGQGAQMTAKAVTEKYRNIMASRVSGESPKPADITPKTPKTSSGMQWKSAPTVKSEPKIKDAM